MQYPTAYRSQKAKYYGSLSDFQNQAPSNTALQVSVPTRSGVITGYVDPAGNLRDIIAPMAPGLTIRNLPSPADTIGTALSIAATVAVLHPGGRLAVGAARVFGRRVGFVSEAAKREARRQSLSSAREKAENAIDTINLVRESELLDEFIPKPFQFFNSKTETANPNAGDLELPPGWEIIQICNSWARPKLFGASAVSCNSLHGLSEEYDTAVERNTSPQTMRSHTRYESGLTRGYIYARIRKIAGQNLPTTSNYQPATIVTTTPSIMPASEDDVPYFTDPGARSELPPSKPNWLSEAGNNPKNEPRPEPKTGGHYRGPPPRGEVQQKGTSGPREFTFLEKALYNISKGFHSVTEGADFVNAAFEALPDDVQELCEGQGLACKMRVLYQNVDQVSMSEFASNLVYNHYEDKIIGTLNQRAQDGARRIETPNRRNGAAGRGLTWGPAF